MNTTDLLEARSERGTPRGAVAVISAARTMAPLVMLDDEATRSGGRRSRVVMVVAALAAMTGALVLVDRDEIGEVTTTERVPTAVTGVSGAVLAPDAEGVSFSVLVYGEGAVFGSNVETEPASGPCELVVVRLDSVSEAVGYCQDDDPPEATSLSEARFDGSGGWSLRGRNFEIMAGRMAPDAFPVGTMIEAELYSGQTAATPFRSDGRFLKAVELESEPQGHWDTSFRPLVWRAVAPDGTVLDSYTIILPTYPVPGP